MFLFEFFMRKLIFILCLFVLSIYSLYANNVYSSLTFAQAAELAVAADIDLGYSRSTQALMQGAWKWGIREYFPRIGINVSENDRLQKIGADSFMKNYSLSFDQLIFDGGRISMSRKLERMELDLTSSRLDRMASEIAEAAISAYRNILSSRAILDIKISALSILEEQRKILNEELELGLALAVDLANADINIADSKIDIYMHQLDLSEMEKQFAEILGLDTLPVLIEKVDVNQPSVLPVNLLKTSSSNISDNIFDVISSLAREQNPDLIEARYSLIKREAEVKYTSNSWIPVLRLTSNFGLSGQRYPLTRYNWSVGVNVDISSPWFQNRFGAQAGWEPSSVSAQSAKQQLYDKTAILQNSLTPLPDPGSRYGITQAKLALSLERDKYDLTYERIGRVATNAIEKCILTGQKRLLIHEAYKLGQERCRIEEIRLELGQITRLKLMETYIEQTQREISLIQAVTDLLSAERELERFLDLKPGELGLFVQRSNQ